MAKTLKERYRTALEARGARYIKDTFKFTVLSRPKGGHYYLGSAGSLRVGTTVGNSRPVSDQFKNALLSDTGMDWAGVSVD